jgi:hypothetical protein
MIEFMDHLLRILLAFFVAVSASGGELRLPQTSVQMDMDCELIPDGSCPCGMPMPQPCNMSVPAPMAVPSRSVTAIVESLAPADQVLHEPKPWPTAWTLVPRLGDEKGTRAEPIPVDTGPPPLPSERAARLRVFQI